MGHGQDQLGPSDTAADDGDIGRSTAIAKLVPGLGKDAKRFGRDAMIGKTRQIRHFRGDADVNRGQIIGNGRSPGHMDHARVWIQPVSRAQDQAGARKTRQSDQINIEVFTLVMTGDKARQHAGIGRGRAGVDQSEPRAGQRAHTPL